MNYVFAKRQYIIFSFHNESRRFFGSYKSRNYNYFIEKCSDYYIAKEYSSGDESTVYKEDVQVVVKSTSEDTSTVESDDDKIDTTTPATFSIMFYYTPEFKIDTPDIKGFVETVVQDMNIGNDRLLRI